MATEVYELPRSTANDLVLASVFAWVCCILMSLLGIMIQPLSLVPRWQKERSKIPWLGGDKKGPMPNLIHLFEQLCGAEGFDEDSKGVEEIQVHPTRSLDFSFDFVEICGGVGSVSKAIAKQGMTAMPLIELSDSPHYDVRDLRLIEWLCYMLQTGLLRSVSLCVLLSHQQHIQRSGAMLNLQVLMGIAQRPWTETLLLFDVSFWQGLHHAAKD